MERSNQQNIDKLSSARATAMRSGVQNPSGSNYEIAGPTIGGTAMPYNSDNIEVAKERLADSFSKASVQDTTTTTTTTTTPGDHTLKDTVVSTASIAAHNAAEAGKTVAAGAAAAGAATVSAVKSFFADKGTTATPVDGTTTTTTKAHPIADFPNTEVHNIHKDSTLNTPPMHTYAATGPIHSVPVQVEPIHSTGLDAPRASGGGNGGNGYRAKEADLHATSGVRAAKVDVHPTTTLNQGYNSHHSMTDKITTPVVGAASAVGAAAAGTAAYMGNKTSELGNKASGLGVDAKESVERTAYNMKPTSLSSSDTPKSTTSSYATMDSTKGTFNPSVSSSNTSYASPAAATTPVQSTHTTTTHRTTTPSSTTPLSEKVKAPVVGAASAVGAAAAGTAAYLGNKTSMAKDTVKDTVNNMKTPSAANKTTSSTTSSNTPAVMEAPAIKSTTYTSAAEATPARVTMGEPFIQTTTTSLNPVTKNEEVVISTVTPVTEPQVVHSPKFDTYQTDTTTTSRTADKNTAPVIGAASTVGAAAAGTAAYMGHKASEAKDSVKGTVHNMTTPSNNNTTSSYSTSNTNNNMAPTSDAYKSTTTSTTRDNSAAPIAAASAIPSSRTTTTGHTPSANTLNELNTADRIAAAIPASYHGTIPQVGPGEEVVWVKTVTTTDYYDDGTSTGRADVVDRHQEAIDPTSFSTVKDNQTVYKNDEQHQKHQEQEHQQEQEPQARGAGRHM
ncbi:hypothetical protein BGX24_005432 [Mortierella sp. AD032]|nr:hypothetical protein BGX24_005432 [Mortierella sp. AD032]